MAESRNVMIVQLSRGEAPYLVHHILGGVANDSCVGFVSTFNMGGEIKREVSDQQTSI